MWRRLRVTMESVKVLAVFVALGLGIFEVTLGGARPSVLTFCGTLIASLLVMKKEEPTNDKVPVKRSTDDSSPDS